MSEKNINGRIINKHDTEVNWNKAISFVPKQGELIVYDVDEKYSYERFKIGDGASLIVDLPFLDPHNSNLITVSDIDTICGSVITSVSINSEVAF